MKTRLFTFTTLVLLIIPLINKANDPVQTDNEFIHVVLDRDTYINGETIWFEIYCKNQNKNEQVNESKLSFIELINSTGHVIARKKVLLNNERGTGNLIIPDTVSTAYYNIIVYTSQSIQQEIRKLAKSTILIYNPEKEIRKTVKRNKRDTLLISTENNKLVADLVNKVHYRISEDVKHFDIVGSNGDSLRYDDTIFDFVEFTPISGVHYKMVCHLSDSVIEYKLPEVKDFGVVFNFEEIKDNKCIFSAKSSKSFRYYNSNIDIYCNSDSRKVLSLKLIEDNQYFEIDCEDLVYGVNKIVIKNADKNNLWERNLIIPFEIYEGLVINDLNDEYGRKSKVTFNLIDNNVSITNVESDVCVSVRKIPVRIKDDKNYSVKDDLNILTDFQSKDYIKINQEVLFNKEKIFRFNGLLKAVNGDKNGRITFSGLLIDNNGHPITNTFIFLSQIDTITRINLSQSNEKGHFQFSLFPKKAAQDFIVYPISESANTVLVDDKYINKYSFLSTKEYNDTSLINNELLKEFYVNNRIQKIYNQNFSIPQEKDESPDWVNYNFFGDPDVRVNFNDFIQLDSIHEYFHELVPFVKIVKHKGKKEFRVIDKKTNLLLLGKPAFFIDGVFYNNSKQFLNLDPEKCLKLEVVRSRYLIYNRAYAGIMSMTTKDGNLKAIEIPYNSTRVEFPLYDESETFKFVPTEDNIPDYRNTLFWEPEITINSEESKLIEFYTGDEISSYEIKVEGFTNDGRFISQSKIIKVK